MFNKKIMIKHIHIFIIVLMTAVFCSHASIIAFDDSSDSVYAGGWGWQNGGSGFDTWMWGGDWWTANADKYINSDTPGEQGFRMWADQGYYVSALRPFKSSLNAGERFSLNLGHWGGNDGEILIRLASDSSPVFQLNLTAGNSYWQAFDGETFDLNDDNGTANYFTTDDNNAEFTFTYNGGSSYGFSLTDSNGNGYSVASKINSAVTASEIQSINTFSIYNYGQGSGSNFYIDNLQIEAIPEPASIGLIGAVCIVGTFIRRKFAV